MNMASIRHAHAIQNSDLQRECINEYYNEATGRRYVLRAILLDLKQAQWTVFVRDLLVNCSVLTTLSLIKRELETIEQKDTTGKVQN